MKFIKFFIFGVLAALGAIVTELILSALFSILFDIDIGKNYSDTITFFLILIILIEEIFKLSLLAKLFSNAGKTSSKIALALFFGSGFALFEVFSKLFFLPPSNFAPILIFSFSGVFLIHTLTAGIMGYFLAKRDGFVPALITKALFLAFSLHFIYNLLIIYEQRISLIGAYLISITIFLYVLKNKLAR